MKHFAALFLAAAWAPAALAQFQLSVVTGNTSQPVATLYNFGTVASGDERSVAFTITNTSTAAAMLTLLGVDGTGFTLSGGPSLPATMNAGASLGFSVTFAASIPGSYSAAFNADGISTQLTAQVVPGLTFQVLTPFGSIALANFVDFGSVPIGQTASTQFSILNQTSLALPIPAMTITSGDFTLSGGAPSGTLAAGQTTGFAIQFAPSVTGPRSAMLTIGAMQIALTGTGLAPAFPTPQLIISLPLNQSGEQGSAQVTFAGAAAISGSGTLTLAFQTAIVGATDPSIAFASGGNTAAFTFNAGDTQASFDGQSSVAFQTGTTAGLLAFTAELGSGSIEQSVTIGSAVVSVTSAQATRSSGSITIDLEGFDNTRSAAALSFSFFDAQGNTLAGPIAADGGAAFQSYFQGSETGGSFELRAVFPVTGDPTRIASFQASVANLQGTATTAKTPF